MEVDVAPNLRAERARPTRFVVLALLSTLCGILAVPTALTAPAGARPAAPPRARPVAPPRARPAGAAATPQFVGLTLVNGWVPSDANPPRATTVDGVVYLTGSMKNGTGTEPFTLPAQFWPATTVALPVTLCDAARAELRINPDGTTLLSWASPASPQCGTSLTGVSYVTGATTALSPLNGWVTSTSRAAPSYMVEHGTVVHFHGAVKSGTSPIIFNVPPAIRPVQFVYVAATMCGAFNGNVVIAPNGNVFVVGDTNFAEAQCEVSLDGVSYLLSASTGLELDNGWFTAAGTRAPGVQVVSGIAHLQGAVAGGRATAYWITALPGGARPDPTQVTVPVNLCSAHSGQLTIEPAVRGRVSVAATIDFADAACMTSLDGVNFPVSTVTWYPIALQNGWANKTGSSPAMFGVGVRRIYLRGTITRSALRFNAVPFTLPAWARPPYDTYLNIDVCNGHLGRLWITSAGVVNVQGNRGFRDPACSTSLEGASFNDNGFLGLTMINGWASGALNTWSAGLDVEGNIATFVGGITGGGVSPNPFVLPVGQRPPTTVDLPVSFCNEAGGRLVIQPDGTVTIQAFGGDLTNAHCFTALDNLSFSVAPGSTLLAYQNGWNLAPGYSPATAEVIEGVVHLSGAIATSATNPVAFTLPPSLRPSLPVSVPVDMCNAAYGRLLIQTDGTVTVQGENSFADAACFTSLEGVQYALTDPDRVVSTSWSSAEVTRLVAMGHYLGGIGPSQVPKTAAYLLSYLNGLNPSGPTPQPTPTQSPGSTFVDNWMPAEFPTLDALKTKYALDDSSAEYFATKVVDFLLALGGH